jgi:transposase
MSHKEPFSSQRSASYPSDVSDEEWAFCAPYLCLMSQEAPQREHALRELFNGVRYIVRAGCPWRMLPQDLPPWHAVYQQARRWMQAGCFEAMAHDLRMMLRVLGGKAAHPTAVVMDGRTLQSSCESGPRAGYDGYRRRKGSKVHVAVDTLGHLLALKVTAANEQERAQVGELLRDVQQATGENVKVAFVDQGYTGVRPAAQSVEHGVNLKVIKLSEARRGFVLLPRRWVVERTFAWQARFRRLARDYERLPGTLASFHWLASVFLMLNNLFQSA